MREGSLDYVIAVLKGETATVEPDWYETLGFLYCHRIVGLFYSRAKALGIALPKKIEKLLESAYIAQTHRNRFMRKWIRRIAIALSVANVEYMMMKGSVLSNAFLCDCETLYCEGERISNDIDILVFTDNVTALTNVLKKMGFVQGKYDSKTREIIPFSRVELINRRLNRGETAPFLKCTSHPEVPFIEVDVNFSLGYTPKEDKELLSEMFGRRRWYKGYAPMHAAKKEYFFLQLLLHQYKESELYFMVEQNKDLDLYKLADIYYIWNSGMLDMTELEDICCRFGLTTKVGAVLGQVGRVFKDEDMLFAAGRYGNVVPEVVNTTTKKTYRWTANERERLLRLDAKELLEEVDG